MVRKIKDNKYLLLLFTPVILYFIIFNYLPMLGLITAFKDYSPFRGIIESPWVGFKYFIQFFDSHFFWILMENTFLLNFYDLIFGFTTPIIFALLLNEVRHQGYKKVIQSVTYMPHFIAIVVIIGMMYDFLSPNGIVNSVLESLGRERILFSTETSWFRTLYVGSGIWQHLGFNTIIYLAAIAGIDPHLYEAAEVDGASRFKKVYLITLPGIANTIVILLILRLGHMMTIGFDKIILMYNGSTYEVADVISTYVYRVGLINGDFSFGTAVGLFNSIINTIILILANILMKKFSGHGIW